MVSLIWSQSLSGWPSVTDSDVKITLSPLGWNGCRSPRPPPEVPFHREAASEAAAAASTRVRLRVSLATNGSRAPTPMTAASASRGGARPESPQARDEQGEGLQYQRAPHRQAEVGVFLGAPALEDAVAFGAAGEGVQELAEDEGLKGEGSGLRPPAVAADAEPVGRHGTGADDAGLRRHSAEILAGEERRSGRPRRLRHHFRVGRFARERKSREDVRDQVDPQ